jgi:hypothetical protein
VPAVAASSCLRSRFLVLLESLWGTSLVKWRAGGRVVGLVVAGPGRDLSEESSAGVGLAALDVRVAPECPPGPA